MSDTQISRLKTILNEISKAEGGERIPKKDFLALINEKIQLCKKLTDRLFEIHRIINFAAKNRDSMLPYKEYKTLCYERQSIRSALQDANWDIHHYEIKKGE